MIRRITPTHSIVSAILKMGKLKMFILIKSLTPQYMSLSTKFPMVHAINNAVMNRLTFSFINNQINTPIPSMLITMTIIMGTGNDREIPLFNTGRIAVFWFR